jgi:hypothetical protein
MHRLSRRPAGYIIAVVLGVAGVGGLSTALAEQGSQGQGSPSVSQSQTQGQGSQGQGSQGQGSQGSGQGQGQGQTDCGQGQGSNCSDCHQGQGQGCTPEVGSENAETPVSSEVTTEAVPAEAVTETAHFGG